MISWRYILTRVVVLLAILVLVRYTLAPIVNYVTVGSIESGTGANVEIANVAVGLFPPTVVYEDLRIAAAIADETDNLAIAADSIEFELDGEAFLHRRYVARDGRINGLKINTDRFKSTSPASRSSKYGASKSQWLADLFGSLAGSAKTQGGSFDDGSEMVKRGDQIRRRWKSEYALLSKRANELEASIKQVQELPVGYANPLRDGARVEATLTRTKEIQAELANVRAEIDEIPSKIQADLISMQNARQSDLDRIDQLATVEITNSENFGTQLLADSVNVQLDRLRQYIQTGRELANWNVPLPATVCLRGQTIDLVRGYRSPSMLIQRCEVNGELRSDGQPMTLSGLIENFTPEQRLREVPFRARLKLEGSQLVRVDYVRDDSSTVVRESLTMHWPEVLAPELELGDRESIGFDVCDGRLEVWADLHTVGDQLQGRLVSRRVGAKIELQASPHLSQTALVSNFKHTMSSVDRLEIDAAFSGTWDDMTVAVSTNLTQVLKTGMEKAVAAQSMVTRAELTAKLNQTYQTQVEDLQKFAATEQTQARDLLAKADTTIQAFSDKVRKESGGPDAYLGSLRGGELK